MKKTALIAIPILVIIMSVGWFLLLNKEKAPTETSVTPTPTVESIPITDLAEDNPYGITLLPRYDKKAVFLKIASFPSGLKSVEYELTYEAKEGSRGVLGIINYNKEGKIQREILLGTCSKNVCRYDEGVKEVVLTAVFRGDKTEKFQGKFSLD